ncbi:MAG: hypothetical protein ACLFRI_03625 [Candidatus Izemoplasmataceae bacterium]
MKLSVQEITMIALSSTIIITMSLIFPYIVLFLFAIMVLAYKKHHAYLISIVVTITLYIATGQLLALMNIVLLPLFIILIDITKPLYYKSKAHLAIECSSAKPISNLRFGIVSFFIIFLLNMINEFAAIFILGLDFEAIYLGTIIAFVGALVNALFLGLIGFYMQQRIQKVLYLANI